MIDQEPELARASLSMVFAEAGVEVLWWANPGDKAHRRTDHGNRWAGSDRRRQPLSRCPGRVVAQVVADFGNKSARCWSEWQDVNLRPPRPERVLLPRKFSIFSHLRFLPIDRNHVLHIIGVH